MQRLKIDGRAPFHCLVGVGGIGTGCLFALQGNETLGRNESRPGQLLDVRDYCKLHIISHYVAKLLGASTTGNFRVLPIGRIGDDARGRQISREMQAAGMDVSLVRTTLGKPTLFSICFQYPDGCGGNITTSNSAAAALTDGDVDAAAGVLNSCGKHGIALAAPEVPLQVRRHFLELATDAGAFRAGSFVNTEIKEACALELFDLLDLVAFNANEAEELVGAPFTHEKPEGFLQRCLKSLRGDISRLNIVVSAGAKGAYAMSGETWNYSFAPKVTVASTAGAGDALLGGILAGIAAGIPFVKVRDDKRRATLDPIETAVDIGVLLSTYKCLSPHTIHPDASLTTLIEFARELRLNFAPDLQPFFVETATPTAR